MLGLAWGGVPELVDSFLYILCHGDIQYACLIVPVQCDATVENPCPILCVFIFFLECMYEVQCVLLSLVFDTKVTDHKGKSDSIIVVALQSRSDWRRLIYEWWEMFLGCRVSDYACLY